MTSSMPQHPLVDSSPVASAASWARKSLDNYTELKTVTVALD